MSGLGPRAPVAEQATPGELLLVALLGAVAAAAGGLWLWGGLAGALFGDGWPQLSAADYVGVAGRLPGHLGDPAAAWPPAARGGLPGAAGFYAAAAGLLALLAAGAWAGGRLVRRAGGWPGRRGRARSSRWARGSDVRRLAVRGPQRARLTLGRVGGRLVAGDGCQSAIVVAPTQTHKTSGLAIPAMLEWEGPVVAASVKTDLVHATLAHRRSLGEVRIFDPTAVTGLPRANWTPLASCHSWQGARRTADRLARAAQPIRGGAEAEFWGRSGARYLAPLLFAAARSGNTIGDVASWVDRHEERAVEEALGGVDGAVRDADEAAACRAALDTLRSVWGADERLRSSLGATAAAALDAYGDPSVIDCSRHADLTAGWLLDGGAHTAYLCATADEQERLAPLFVTLLSEIRAAVYDRAAARGRPLDPPLLLVLDEAANIAPLPDLDTIAATGAGQGIQLVTVVQDLEQMERRWPGRAGTVVNNHRAKIVGSGISDGRTLDYFARMLGDEQIRQTSTSTSAGGGGRSSRTEAPAWRALAPANVLREAPQGTGVLVYGNLPPARLQLRPWFRERSLRRLVQRRAAA